MSTNEDWAARRAAEMLPCKHAPDARCAFDETHAYDCAAQYRPAIAQALREERERATQIVLCRDQSQFTSGALGRYHIADAIRALAAEPETEGGEI